MTEIKVSPIMTSSNTPAPYVITSSSDISESYASWKAFDGNYLDNTSRWIGDRTKLPVWIQIGFNKPTDVGRYQLTANQITNAETGHPKSWTLIGSDNEIDWEVLDSRTNISWATGEKKSFLVQKPKNYKYYRVNVTDSWGTLYVSIQEIEFYYTPVNKILILNENSYKKWDETWQNISISTPTEQQYIENGMDDLSIIPESALKELKGEIKLSYFTDNPSTNEITIETETEPYSIYDEFGYDEEGDPLPMEVLYYTDDPDKSKAELEITANYSPLDEIDGDFEVVTWTDEEAAERILGLSALPKPQFIKQIDSNDVYGTITEFLTTESFSGTENGIIRYLLSPDRTVWKTWNGLAFADIDTSNMSNIVANGLNRAALQSLTNSEWSKWVGQKLYLGIYLEEDMRNKTKAHINSISYKDSVPKESTHISDAKLYILNTVSTINVSFAGSTITGIIDDEDEGKVQYRIKLNGNDYFPADGSFTPLMASPLNISTTLSNEDILIDENNTLRIEFKDYWGSIDYWQTNFTGTYSGLLFMDETGEYYSTDIGGILQYLDFGVIIAGQTTIEQAILLKNTYGYTVDNINIRANQAGFPSGMKAQFGTNEISFEALDILSLEGQMEDGDERTFYIRLSTQLGVTPQANGEFDIIVTADKVDTVEA